MVFLAFAIIVMAVVGCGLVLLFGEAAGMFLFKAFLILTPISFAVFIFLKTGGFNKK